MTRDELVQAFSLEGVNRSNAVVNFTDEDPFDPESRLAECGAHPHACRPRCLPKSCSRS